MDRHTSSTAVSKMSPTTAASASVCRPRVPGADVRVAQIEHGWPSTWETTLINSWGRYARLLPPALPAVADPPAPSHIAT
jgi:hypothetical protein